MATKTAVMDGGVIQQFGTPDEIYETPANLFVADFVGSPSMNVVESVVEKKNGGVTAEGDGLSFDLSRYPFRQQPAEGQKVKVGFRPEHLRVANGAPPSERQMRLDLPISYF